MMITIETQPAKEDYDIVNKGLDQFNQKYVDSEYFQALNVFARDESGQIIGGLLGGTFWRWLHIEVLWVADTCRGQGIGQKLMAAAEQEAARRGCLHAQLETHEFQAPAFYQKLGYRVFGELDDFPPGHKKYFLVKDGL